VATKIQSKTDSQDGHQNPTSATFDNPVVAGRAILVVGSWDYSVSTFTSISDSKGNVYQQIGAAQDSTATQEMRAFCCLNAPYGGSSFTVNLNFAAAPQFTRIGIAEMDRMQRFQLDQIAVAIRTNWTAGVDGTVSPPITPTRDGSTIVGFVEVHAENAGEVAPSTGTGFTEDCPLKGSGSSPDVQIEHLDQVTAAAITAKWTPDFSLTFCNIVVASFKPTPQILYWNRAKARRGRRFTTLAK
jgi:hypothetical protein